MDYESLPHFCKREGPGSSRDSLDGVDCYSYDHPFHQQLYNYMKQQSLNQDSVGPRKQGSVHVDVPSPGLEEVKPWGGQDFRDNQSRAPEFEGKHWSHSFIQQHTDRRSMRAPSLRSGRAWDIGPNRSSGSLDPRNLCCGGNSASCLQSLAAGLIKENRERSREWDSNNCIRDCYGF